MKTWPITLTLLGAAAIAHADGMPGAIPADAAKTAPAQTQTTAMPAQAQTKAMQRPSHRKARHFPHGDLRYCLESGGNAAIIRCAEKPPRQ